jgi:thiol-disulfide isomerase/thioredoxin
MHRRPRLALLAALAAGCVLGASLAAADVKVGAKVDKLSFTDIHYLPRSLDDFPRAKAFAFVFTNTSCPVVQRYLPVLRQLDKDYRDKGVQFLAVDADGDDAVTAVAAQAVEHDVEFPFVKDFDGPCARALGIRRTATVVVLDGQHRLRYRGRIDDQYRFGGTRAAAEHHELRDALDAVLAGQEVAVAETPVDGCLIAFPEPPAANPAVTFAKDVAPILRKNCQECHRPGTAAPFALVTAREVASRADMVAEVVTQGRMPPWFGTGDHGAIVNRRGLTADERSTILTWVRSGMPKGDDTKLPPPPAEDTSQWQIGTPDLVLTAPFSHSLPAEGDIPYKYAVIPYAFPEDTWVQGVQILPDNPRVLHHCNLVYILPSEGYKQQNLITGTVPGADPLRLDHGIAFRIPQGAVLGMQIHYISTGKPEKCRVSVGLKYAGGHVERRLRHFLLEDSKFAIPPGASAYPVRVSRVLDRDVTGVGLFVHMHLRGRDMTFTAHSPNGTPETLLVVPNYNFSWQVPYRWEPGKKHFPKGTRLECVAHYDNSAFNPYNPDPAATVRFGQQTHDEMMNGFFFYTDDTEKLNLNVDPKTGRAPPVP